MAPQSVIDALLARRIVAVPMAADADCRYVEYLVGDGRLERVTAHRAMYLYLYDRASVGIFTGNRLEARDRARVDEVVHGHVFLLDRATVGRATGGEIYVYGHNTIGYVGMRATVLIHEGTVTIGVLRGRLDVRRDVTVRVRKAVDGASITLAPRAQVTIDRIEDGAHIARPIVRDTDTEADASVHRDEATGQWRLSAGQARAGACVARCRPRTRPATGAGP